MSISILPPPTRHSPANYSHSRIGALRSTLRGRSGMADHSLLSPWIRRFLLEHLIAERNLAHNTQQSYRDALCLLLPFASKLCKKRVDALTVYDLSGDVIKAFLSRNWKGCAVARLVPATRDSPRSMRWAVSL